MKTLTGILIISFIVLMTIVGMAALIPQRQFATIAPLTAAASSTIEIEYENMHTVLFFDVVTSSNATMTILASPTTYNITKVISAGNYKFFVHPLDTVFYAPDGILTITKEGTFTTLDIYVIETSF